MSKRRYKDEESYRKYTSTYKKRRRDREKPYAFSYKYPYTIEEREMILKHEIPDVEIGKIIGRTTMAIQTQRSKWKKQYGREKNVC